MEVSVIKELQDKIDKLEKEQERLRQKQVQFEIDKQMYVKGNDKILPGIGCKIAFDENGLVLSSDNLSSSDVPNLEIDKINGLQAILSSKANKMDLTNVQVDYDTIFAPRAISGTGCKVNYDKYGVIQSSTNLSIEDIPLLPVESIEGLHDELNDLKTSILNINSNREEESKISPGTSCKVTFDKYGKIVGTGLLDMNDIPIEIFNRLNTLDSKLLRTVTVDRVDNLTSRVDKKIDKDNRSTSGVFTKVKVNNDGLVIEGSNLTGSDLNLEIKDIRELFETLQNKAEHSDVARLNSTVSKLVSNMNTISDFKRLENKIDNSISKEELNKLNILINTIKKDLENLNKVDIKVVTEQLKDLRSDISTINTRLSNLERNIKKK